MRYLTSNNGLPLNSGLLGPSRPLKVAHLYRSYMTSY